MNNFRKISLSYIVPAIVFIVFILLQVNVFFLEYKASQDKLYTQKEQYIKGITGSLQTRLSNSLMRLEKAQAQNIVLETALDDNVKNIAVIDHNQQIVLSNRLRDKYLFAKLQLPHYDANLLQQVVERNEFIFQYNELTKDLIVYAPLQMLSKGNSLNRKFNGLIFMRYSLDRAITELRYEALYSLIKISLTLLMSLAVLIYITNVLIIKPLKRLSKVATLADLTSLSVNPVKGFGEIGYLQRAFTQLSTEVNETIARLTLSEQRLLYALSGARDGVWDWDIEHDNFYASERWKEMIGFKADDISSNIEEWESRIHESDLYAVMKELQQHITGKNSFFEVSHRLRGHNGEYHWVLCRGQTVSWDAQGLPLRIIGTITDISHYKESQQLFTSQSLTNAATKLPGRSELLITLEKECERALHNHRLGGVIFIECDQYKTTAFLQDDFSDNNLQLRIAQRITALTQASDFVAHLGGSEFAIIVTDLTHQDELAAEHILAFAKQLESSLQAPFNINNNEVQLTCTFGITLFPQNSKSSQELLREANMALTFSHDSYFGNIAFFSKNIELQIQQHQLLQNQIHHALQHDEFSLHFQPRVDENNRLVGAEALIRWLHSAQGWVKPAQFIPVAEECGLIVPVGNWVIEHAFAQLAKWQTQGLPPSFTRLSINISGKQLLEEDFIDTLQAQLEKTQLDAQLIELEITESVLVEHGELVIEKLNKLRTLGFCLTIDDFGIGYSSFSYLSLLPVSAIKIDQSFIHNVMDDAKQQVIVSAIINMANDLDLHVVAEGVESEAQLEFLIALGCQEFQGFLIGLPLARQEFQALLFKK